MSRFNLILVVLAVVQLVCIYLLSPSFNADSADVTTAKKLIAFDLADVQAIEVSELDSKELIKIKRNGEGWVLPEQDDFPVVGGKLTRPKQEPKKEGEDVANAFEQAPGILDKLAELEVRSPLVRLAKNHAVMNVADDKYSRRMTLLSASGKTIGRIYVARGSNGNSCYIRREGSDDVYETEEFRNHEFSPSVINWSGRNLIQVDTNTISGLSIKREDETQNAELKRDEKLPLAWNFTAPVQEKAKRESVEVIVNKLCSLAIEDIYGKSAPKDGGFDKPLARYKLTLASGGNEVITIGKKLKDGDYTAYWNPSSSKGSGYYVQLSAWSIEDAVETTLDDLLIKPEPPGEDAPPLDNDKK